LKQRVVVRFRAGPTWISGPSREQQGWNEHAAYVDDLVDRGIFVLGGPLTDNSGAVVVLENVNVEDARRLVDADPFVHNGVFVLESVDEWTVYVDQLSS
jgi:uncharacterized protein